jgi:hypothetical protein
LTLRDFATERIALNPDPVEKLGWCMNLQLEVSVVRFNPLGIPGL